MFSIFWKAKKGQLSGVLAAIASCAAITLLSILLVSYLAPLNIVMLYLVGVVFLALFYGRISASISAIINVASFDFFFISPHFSFAVHDVQYLLTFLVMLLVGLVIGQLTAWARTQAHVALSREETARNLYEMAKALSSVLTEADVITITKSFFSRSFNSEPELLLPDHAQKLHQINQCDLKIDMAVADWSFTHQQKAGAGIELFSETALQYVPLTTPSRTLGVLVLETNDSFGALMPEQLRLLDTYALLIASALERLKLAAEAEEAKLHRESERLRNTLLAALSHDLRTPLTVLFTQVELLAQSLVRDSSPYLPQIEAIKTQVLGTSRLVNNLLDMARLESEGVHLRKEWQSMQEMVGSALTALSVQLTANPLTIDIPAEMPLVFCDGVLIERVLVNLLENAGKYAGKNVPVGVEVTPHDSEIRTLIWNSGPALPKGKEQQIFEKFTRGEKESVIPGIGLGLSICKMIVETHGGRIWAENRNTGGVSFYFTLPVQPFPELEPEPVSI